VGKVHLLLLEGRSKRDQSVLMGKTDTFKNGYVAVSKMPIFKAGQTVEQREFSIGDYLAVRVESVGARSLQCKPLGIVSSLPDFYSHLSFY
jgi:hypothetical protein